MPQRYFLHPERELVELDEKPFASGGEGELYSIRSPRRFHRHVAKLYFAKKRDAQRASKIHFLLEHPPQNDAHSHPSLVWPEDILHDESGQFAGFIMPRAEGEPLEVLCAPKLPKHLGSEWQRLDFRYEESMRLRAKVCYNIAAAIHRLHQTGQYVLVDLKPENIILQANGLISMVDMDSIEVLLQGDTLYPATVATPEYTPPEYYRGVQPGKVSIGDSWDRFSMAVIFYRLLFGIHPYAATALPPFDSLHALGDKIREGLFVQALEQRARFAVVPPLHQRFSDLDRGLQALFIQAFEAGQNDPQQRPSAEEWGRGFLQSALLLVDRQLPSRQVQVVLPKAQNWYNEAFEQANRQAFPTLPAVPTQTAVSLVGQSNLMDLAAPMYQQVGRFLGNAGKLVGAIFVAMSVIIFLLGYLSGEHHIWSMPFQLIGYAIYGLFYFTFQVPILLVLSTVPFALAWKQRKELTNGKALSPGLQTSAIGKKRVQHFEKQQYKLFLHKGKLKYKIKDLQTQLQLVQKERNEMETQFARQHRSLIQHQQQQLQQQLQQYAERLQQGDASAKQLFEEEARLLRQEQEAFQNRLQRESPFTQLAGKSVAEKLQGIEAWKQQQFGTAQEIEAQAEALRRDLLIAQKEHEQQVQTIRQQYDTQHQIWLSEAQHIKRELEWLNKNAADDFRQKSRLDNLLLSPTYRKWMRAQQEILQEIAAQEQALQQIQDDIQIIRQELAKMR